MMASGFKSFSSLLFHHRDVYVEKQFLNEKNFMRLLTLFMFAFYAYEAHIRSLCFVFCVCVQRIFLIMDFHTCMEISHKPSLFYAREAL